MVDRACLGVITSLRMGEDSNPRRTQALSSFQDCRLRPLGHPSKRLKDEGFRDLPPDLTGIAGPPRPTVCRQGECPAFSATVPRIGGISRNLGGSLSLPSRLTLHRRRGKGKKTQAMGRTWPHRGAGGRCPGRRDAHRHAGPMAIRAGRRMPTVAPLVRGQAPSSAARSRDRLCGSRHPPEVMCTMRSGWTPFMSESCETIREPGLSFSNCGISFTFNFGSRYKVITFASLRSSVKMAFSKISATSRPCSS